MTRKDLDVIAALKDEELALLTTVEEKSLTDTLAQRDAAEQAEHDLADQYTVKVDKLNADQTAALAKAKADADQAASDAKAASDKAIADLQANNVQALANLATQKDADKAAALAAASQDKAAVVAALEGQLTSLQAKYDADIAAKDTAYAVLQGQLASAQALVDKYTTILEAKDAGPLADKLKVQAKKDELSKQIATAEAVIAETAAAKKKAEDELAALES